MQPWCSTPYLHYAISSIQLSPHSPFYHHCFPSLRCRREEDLSRTPNDLPSERCTYQNIIINATATAMHDKDPFQSYAPTMRGQQYSDQQEPPPLRLSSTSYIVLRLHLHRLHRSTVHRYTLRKIYFNATAITTHPPLFGQLVCCSIFFAVRSSSSLLFEWRRRRLCTHPNNKTSKKKKYDEVLYNNQPGGK